ncbi:zinc finger protein 583-like isoform X2 [Ambystoma mexicanum]|uniref:zinc finger protein 583-like isoform X2 n=1 Tax=Ambystoma mexicanum TaxID=8296 RepID=UPI0037E915FD
MKTSNDIPQQKSHEAPLTFCDVAARFSEEEWKLLHTWQKELYTSVMKEFHRAFNSLAPLVATAVFSLRPKDKKVLRDKDLPDLEIASSVVDAYSGHMTADSGIFFRGNDYLKHTDEWENCENSCTDQIRNYGTALKKEEESKMDHYGAQGDTSITDPSLGDHILNSDDDLGKEDEQESHLIGHYGAERGESISGPITGSDVSTSVASIGINEDGETYAIYIDDGQKRLSFNGPPGNKSMKRKKKQSFSLQCNDGSTLCKPMENEQNTSVVHSLHGTKEYIYPMCSRSDQELRGTRWKIGYNQQTNSNLHQMTPAQRSAKPNESKSTIRNGNIISCDSSPLQPTCPKSEESCQKNNQTQHQQTYKMKRRYTCAECGKSFTAIPSLIRHERIHTGEKPFPCTICGKRFNRKEVLIRHQKSHSGERPYQCNVCGKGFNRKDYHLVHQKTHTKVQHIWQADLL